GTYSDQTTANLTGQVTWTSQTTTIATVNPAGLAQTVGQGSTVISATLAGVTGTTVLTVSGPSPKLTSITIAPSNPGVPKGRTEQFTATGHYANNSTQNLTGEVTWTSAN